MATRRPPVQPPVEEAATVVEPRPIFSDVDANEDDADGNDGDPFAARDTSELSMISAFDVISESSANFEVPVTTPSAKRPAGRFPPVESEMNATSGDATLDLSKSVNEVRAMRAAGKVANAAVSSAADAVGKSLDELEGPTDPNAIAAVAEPAMLRWKVLATHANAQMAANAANANAAGAAQGTSGSSSSSSSLSSSSSSSASMLGATQPAMDIGVMLNPLGALDVAPLSVPATKPSPPPTSTPPNATVAPVANVAPPSSIAGPTSTGMPAYSPPKDRVVVLLEEAVELAAKAIIDDVSARNPSHHAKLVQLERKLSEALSRMKARERDGV